MVSLKKQWLERKRHWIRYHPNIICKWFCFQNHSASNQIGGLREEVFLEKVERFLISSVERRVPLERTSGTVTVRPVGKILIDKVVKIRPTSIMEFSMTLKLKISWYRAKKKSFWRMLKKKESCESHRLSLTVNNIGKGVPLFISSLKLKK